MNKWEFQNKKKITASRTISLILLQIDSLDIKKIQKSLIDKTAYLRGMQENFLPVDSDCVDELVMPTSFDIELDNFNLR